MKIVVKMTCAAAFAAALLVTPAFAQEDPCTATPIAAASQALPGDTTGAAGSGFNSSCEYAIPTHPASPDHWWVMTVVGCATVEMTTCPAVSAGAVGFDTNLSIWSGPAPGVLAGSCPILTPPGPLSLVACNDDATPCFGTWESHIPPTVVGPGTYYLRIAGFSGTDFGPYNIILTVSPPPLTLLITQPGGPGSGSLDMSACGGGANDFAFMAASFAPENVGGGYGTGWWLGLHILPGDLINQYNWGGLPFTGNLNASGNLTFITLGNGTIPGSFAGMTLSANVATFDETVFSFTGSSSVAQITF